MEVMFVAKKTEAVANQRLAFQTDWGLPLTAEVTFTPGAAAAAAEAAPQASTSAAGASAAKKRGRKPARSGGDAEASVGRAGAGAGGPVDASKTTVRLSLRFQLADVLVQTHISPWAVQTNVREIVEQNLQARSRPAVLHAWSLTLSWQLCWLPCVFWLPCMC